MSKLRALGRRQFLIWPVVFLLAGGWSAWRLLGQSIDAATDPQAAQTDPLVQTQAGLSSSLAGIRQKMESGRYADALAQINLPGTAAQPAILRYKAIAQLVTGDNDGALQTADLSLAGGATGRVRPLLP